MCSNYRKLAQSTGQRIMLGSFSLMLVKIFAYLAYLRFYTSSTNEQIHASKHRLTGLEYVTSLSVQAVLRRAGEKHINHGPVRFVSHSG
jgi:hypothetical protein